MKNLVYIAFLLVVGALAGCQDKEIDIAAEEEAIKAVINEETSAYLSQDLVKLLPTLIQDENSIYISIGSLGYIEKLGWEELYPYYKKMTAGDMSDYEDITTVRSNWKINICGESAFVIYNQEMKFTYKGDPMETHSKELRFLEKIKGDWKIGMVEWIDLSSFETEGEAVGKEF